MIDHIGIDVSDFQKSKAFYTQTLRPLGIKIIVDVSDPKVGASAYIGMGFKGKPFFWFGESTKQSSPVHIAFSSPDRKTVNLFHKAALLAGGKDNGPPDLRPHYHANYYGAFILDPDGNNIEAVCHIPQSD